MKKRIGRIISFPILLVGVIIASPLFLIVGVFNLNGQQTSGVKHRRRV